MKGIVITTDGKMSVQEFALPLFESMKPVIGGWIEHVHPRRLAAPYCMIVDEEGLLKGYGLNLVGSYLYETDKHGQPIVGTIVLMKDGYRDGEPDIVGLDDSDIDTLAADIARFTKGLVVMGGDS